MMRFKKNIVRFNVAMQNEVIMQRPQRQNQLPEHQQCLLLPQPTLALNQIL